MKKCSFVTAILVVISITCASYILFYEIIIKEEISYDLTHLAVREMVAVPLLCLSLSTAIAAKFFKVVKRTPPFQIEMLCIIFGPVLFAVYIILCCLNLTGNQSVLLSKTLYFYVSNPILFAAIGTLSALAYYTTERRIKEKNIERNE